MKILKYLFFSICVAIVFSSCSTHTETASRRHIFQAEPATLPPSAIPEKKLSGKREIIVQHAINNLGKPYRWGGHSPKNGFDCSGLIFYTHKKAKINTPRTANALYRAGKTISKQKLTPADLVFFKTPQADKYLHVGIYIGDGIFVHAPGKGRHVTRAKLNNPYFRRYYMGSRSFL